MTNPAGGPPPPPGPPPAQPPAVPDTTGVAAVPRYAEWWKRVVATIVDSVLLGIVGRIIGAIFGLNDDPMTGQLDGGGNFFAGLILGQTVMILIGIAYYVALNGSEKGQTVGKMLMKIRVRDEATGGPAGYGKAFIRYIVGTVLFLLCIIPGLVDLLFPLWDPKKQTLHDKAANTIVEDIG